jgi:hypothetical protein
MPKDTTPIPPSPFTDADYAQAYSFPVVFTITGNQHNTGKTIDIGHTGTSITTSPGWKLTVTADQNRDGVFEEVLTTNINGTIKTTPLDDGTTLFTYNGHNLIGDPSNGGDPGVAYYELITGHFTWVGGPNTDPTGNAVTIEPLSGHGRVVDLADYFGL